MNYMTKDGIEFHVIPDDAVCLMAMKHPDQVTTCPEKNFDDTGNTCVPELCDFYCENCGIILGDE